MSCECCLELCKLRELLYLHKLCEPRCIAIVLATLSDCLDTVGVGLSEEAKSGAADGLDSGAS